MHEMTSFEQRLAGRLEAEVARAARPFDPSAVAQSAIGPATLWDRLLNAFRAGDALPLQPTRKLTLLAVTALLVLLTVALVVGASRLGGPRLALLRPNGDVVAVNADGSNATLIGHIPASPLRTELSWAPDGEHLAMLGDDWVLTIVDRTGSITASRQLEDRGSQFAWSPDGRRLAVYDGAVLRDEPESSEGPPLVRPHLDILDVDGTVAWTATLPDELRYSIGLGAVSWSRDGQFLAVTGFRANPNGQSFGWSFRSSVWVVDAATHAARAVRPEDPTAGDFMPAWLPDGRILVVRRHTGLVVIDPGSGVESVAYEFQPEVGSSGFMTDWSLSPDGARVAMVAPVVGLAVLDLQTRAVHDVPMPANPTGGGWPPIRWNAAGTAVLMRWGEVTDDPFYPTQVASMNLETGEATVLASDVVDFGVQRH